MYTLVGFCVTVYSPDSDLPPIGEQYGSLNMTVLQLIGEKADSRPCVQRVELWRTQKPDVISDKQYANKKNEPNGPGVVVARVRSGEKRRR